MAKLCLISCVRIELFKRGTKGAEADRANRPEKKALRKRKPSWQYHAYTVGPTKQGANRK